MTTSQTRGRAGLAEDLRISIARLSRRLRAQSTSTLSLTQFATLAALESHEVMTPGELAEHEKVRPPSMTRVITVLEEDGLLARAPHPTDGRQVVLTATDRGREALKEERRRREAWLARRLQELTKEERAILRRAAPVLEKLSRA